VTRFQLSWPEQRAARIMRGPNGPLQPVRIVVNYSQGVLHPHLSGSATGFWPFQVTSAADARRQRGVLAAIVELELHQRVFEIDWRILPISSHSELEHSCPAAVVVVAANEFYSLTIRHILLVW
jgi:hypothetical protein